MPSRFRLFLWLLILIICHPAQATIELRLQEWGYLPDGYQQRFAQFAKERGVDVDLLVIPRLITDFSSVYMALEQDEADVTMPTSYFFGAHDDKLVGQLLPIDRTQLSRYRYLLPGYKKTRFDQRGDDKYSIPSTVAIFATAFDGSTREAPDSWGVFFRPQSTEQFSVFCDQFEPFVMSTLIGMGEQPQAFKNGEAFRNPELEKELLEALTKRLRLSRGFWFNQEHSCEQLKLQSLATTWGFELQGCSESNGQRWKLATNREGMLFAMDSYALSKRLANRPEKLAAAYLLIDFLLSKDEQQRLLQGVPSIQGVVRDIVRNFSPAELDMLPVELLPMFDERLLIPVLDDAISLRYKALLSEALEASGKVTMAESCPWDLKQ